MKANPFGLVVHTAGRGIVSRAAKRGVNPVQLALSWYKRKGSVHYLIDYDGDMYQMLPSNAHGAHVGIGWLERRRYLDGSWRRRLPAMAVRRWDLRWRGWKSPQHLYPTKSPNACYVGVEMLPMPSRRAADGAWFTDAQHRAVSELYTMLAEQYEWPRQDRRRLLGHEDIDGFARWDAYGGWDPGGMRAIPRFDWSRVEAARAMGR